MASPKITVGVPTFNRADLLRATIESVLAQTFTDFRCIISDNASTDDTPTVARSFRDSRIEYVRSERNVGSIANINQLIALTDTEFVVILPDDDLLCPEHLEKSLAVLEGSASAGFVHSAFYLIDPQSRVLERVSSVRSTEPITLEPGERALERMMVTRGPVNFSSALYRTRAIREAGDFVVVAGPCADLRLWMRIAAAWDIAYIAEPLVGFRAHQGSISANIGGDRGVALGDDQQVYLHTARMADEQRRRFLDEGRLNPGRTARLRAIAALQILIDEAYAGLPSVDVARCLARLLRTYPRLICRLATWRLIAAQSGGRRMHSSFGRVSSRTSVPSSTALHGTVDQGAQW